jgi:hypothetical protein
MSSEVGVYLFSSAQEPSEKGLFIILFFETEMGGCYVYALFHTRSESSARYPLPLVMSI